MSTTDLDTLRRDSARRVDELLAAALDEVHGAPPKLDHLEELLDVARTLLEVARALEPCPDCDEDGRDEDGEPCPGCAGRGLIEPPSRGSA